MKIFSLNNTVGTHSCIHTYRHTHVREHTHTHAHTLDFQEDLLVCLRQSLANLPDYMFINLCLSNCQTRMTIECTTPVVYLDFVHTHNTELNVPPLWYIFTSCTQAHAQHTHTHTHTHTCKHTNTTHMPFSAGTKRCVVQQALT